MHKPKVYYIDIDDTICRHPKEIPLHGNRDYEKAVPDLNKIRMINELYERGHNVVYWTARGSRSGKDWHDFTLDQLVKWGCKFSELRTDKPYYDVFIEDRSMKIENVKFYIAHRGNLDGSHPDQENRQEYIEKAITNGFDVEIDIWLLDNGYWLGHDEPQYKTSVEWLCKHSKWLWIHTKNIGALNQLLEYPELHLFSHTQDPFNLTSKGYVWTHDLTQLTPKSIVPLLGLGLEGRIENREFHAICSDYVRHYKNVIEGAVA